MAKKPASTGGTPASALKAALPADVRVIELRANASVRVDVDVNDMVIPYTVALDGSVVIKSLVDRREPLPALTPGTHRLGWGFAHGVKQWMHKISILVDGVETVLERKSEAAKDSDHSIGVVFLVVA